MVALYVWLIGLCAGSFVGALVWRLALQNGELKYSARLKKAKKTQEELSILRGRSCCEHCGHRLATFDLLPLLSWLRTGGRCQYCQVFIGWSPLLLELAVSTVFLLSYLFWPQPLTNAQAIFEFASWLVIATGLAALFVYDVRWMLLPNRVVYPLLMLAGVRAIVLAIWMGDPEPIRSAVTGLVILGGGFWLLFSVSKGRWIGGGDVKLGFLLGILAGGALKAGLVLLLASLLGTLVVLPLLALKRLGSKSHVPFGPFLILAAWLIIIWGTQLADYYLRLAAPGLQ